MGARPNAPPDPPQEFRRLRILEKDGAMSRADKFSPEVRERSVKMVMEHQGEYASQWSAIVSVSAKAGPVKP
ncbi:hypothetical protein C2859_18310 [Xanthomonas citri pv. glycines]|nr:hypothetical protein BHE84_24560 [Xanthomonas citri pv. glycines str. 8ra]QEQ74698.1 hypothetical protein C2859_18310 [Xanthomonas citri pv. glycines]